jgi:hypothetical protein
MPFLYMYLQKTNIPQKLDCSWRLRYERDISLTITEVINVMEF